MLWIAVTKGVAISLIVVVTVALPVLSAPAIQFTNSTKIAHHPENDVHPSRDMIVMDCVKSTIPLTICGNLQNSSCICTDKVFARLLQPCLERTRAFRGVETIVGELESVKDVYPVCKNRPYHKQFKTICVALIILGLTATCLRLYARSKQHIFRSDDAVMVVLLANLIAYSILLLLTKGFGKHVWELEPETVIYTLKLLFVFQFLYVNLLTLSKISMILVYIRIFPGRTFKVLALITAGFVLVTFLAIYPLTFTDCLPVYQAYTPTNGLWRVEEFCRNTNRLAMGYSVCNAIQEWIILFLPLPHIFQLKIRWQKKLALVALFSWGIFTCIISTFRISKITKYGPSSNPTFDYAETILWAIIEVYLNVLVPNLLGIYSLLASKFPKFFGQEDERKDRHLQNSFFRNRALGGQKHGRVGGELTNVSVECEEVLGGAIPLEVEASVEESSGSENFEEISKKSVL